jgi:nucleoside-diphosphate-sugar epimerase
MQIAILGANGRLAHAVAKAALDNGHSVIAVTRSGKCDGLEGQVEYRKADAMVEAELVDAARGADLIFNGLNPLYTEWNEKVMVMARNVMAAAIATRAVHLFIGNVYNYGKEIPLNANEDTPFRTSTEKAVQRNAMEALFEEKAKTADVKTIILRAGDFYGTARPGTWVDQMIATKFSKGVFTWPGPMEVPHAFAYLPDLAKTFIALAERHQDLPLWSHFNFEGHTLTGTQFKAISEQVLGKPLKRAGVPWIVIRALGFVQPMMREIAKMSYLWFTPHTLDGRKLAHFLGTVPTADPKEAIRQTYLDLGYITPEQANTRIA